MQDIRDKIFSLTKNAAKTSGEFFKSTKLSMSLSTEENNLRSLYMEIGKKVHEIYQYGGTLGKFFDEKYLEIEALEGKISDIREQISSIKGVKICTKCGKSVDRTAEFCHKCGIRVELGHEGFSPTSEQPANIQIPELQPEALPKEIIETIETTHVRNCRVCNSTNESTAKFCLSCGRILD